MTDVLQRNLREALKQRRLKEAEDLIRRLKSEDPHGKESRALELEFYIEAGRFSQADALSRQLCLFFPKSGRILFLAGKLAYRKKHFEAAEIYFRESQSLFPHASTQRWLGKTLTQRGNFAEAESFLLAVKEHDKYALLDLGWLYEKKGNPQAALRNYDEFLSHHPGNSYALECRLRLKAQSAEPGAAPGKAHSPAGAGEDEASASFPENVDRLFLAGQAPRARDLISTHLGKMDAQEAVRLAWICYHHQAFDLACSLFLTSLVSNSSNVRHLAILESSARRCNRLEDVVSAYQRLLPEARHLHGRCKSLARHAAILIVPLIMQGGEHFRFY